MLRRLIILVVFLSLFLVVVGVKAEQPSKQLYFPVTYVVEKERPRVVVESEAPFALIEQFYNPNVGMKVSVRMSDAAPNRNDGYDWRTLDKKLLEVRPYWVTVKMTPEWANSGEICELPDREYWDDYAGFVQTVILRYNPDKISLWNEPDVPLNMLDKTLYPHFGCIGDGTAYGEFVGYVYDHVTWYDTELVIGEVSTLSPDFLIPMFAAVGDRYDAFGVHCYEYFVDNTLYPRCQDVYAQAKQYTEKPVYMSEIGVYAVVTDEAAFDVEAYHSAQVDLYTRMKDTGTTYVLFTVGGNGWPACETVDCSTDITYRDPTTRQLLPRPVWFLYANE